MPITPGGVGVVELTYIAGLVLAGGSPIRARRSPLPCCFGCTYVLQIHLGGVTYLIWQRNKSWRKPVHPEPSSPVPALPA